MGRSGRWSLLQAEILAQLRTGRVDSVSDLARTLEKSRPAVSRALRTLSDQGIVQRLGRSWSLTESGAIEAEKSVARLRESTEEIVEVAGQRFRALNRAGLGETLTASMSSLMGLSFPEVARSMLEEQMTVQGLGLMAESMIADRNAIGALSTIGSVQESLANMTEMSALSGATSGFGLEAMGQAVLGSSLREAAGLLNVQRGAEEYIASLGIGNALAAAQSLGSISAGFVPGALTRELGLSLADRMNEIVGASVKSFADYSGLMISDYSTLLGSDYSALAKSVGVISGRRDAWPSSFVDAASALAGWEESFAAAIGSYHEDNAAKIGDILSGLAQVDLPEPLLSDALRVYGLNSERIHTPTYWLPPVQPMESIEDARLRASNARRRRINDARDTLITLEETIRSLIETTLSRQHGSTWWKRSVPQRIREDCIERKRRREAVGGLSHDLIDYTYTNELKDIILKGDNWHMAFSSTFRNKPQVEAVFLWMEPVRNDIAHSRISSDRDYKQFKFAATWLIEAAADALEEDLESDAAD